MNRLLKLLEGGDRRSIGKVDQVVRQAQQDPALIGELVEGLVEPDLLVRMRAADALEKLTAQSGEALEPYKRQLFKAAAEVDQQEVRWHMAQMLPRLKLTPVERKRAVDLMKRYLDDQSRIVQTFALQALADFASRDTTLRPEVIEIIQRQMASGSPAVKARGRKLLAQLHLHD